MKILVKFPTRSRGEKFKAVLQRYLDTCADHKNTAFLISYDLDDETMNDDIFNCFLSYKNVLFVGGTSKNKIHACNRDVNEYNGHWDIVMLASDDMIPQVKGWDKIVRQAMLSEYPDTDGALWFNDGHQNDICTFTIKGRKYYNRFGYMYHPDYVSLWCDNELTDVARKLGRLTYYPHVLFKHEHPTWMSDIRLMDEQYRKTESYYQVDKATYQTRKARNFDLS